MCMFGSPKAPAPPPKAPEAPMTPEKTGVAMTDADRRRRAAAAGGQRGGTILTGSRGISDGATTATPSLLGGSM